MSTITVALPVHLRRLARVEEDLRVEVADTPTIRRVLDAVEAEFPMLRGTIREHDSGERRAFIRFFADGRDLSHTGLDEPLPHGVGSGDDVFCVIGAIAGG